MRPSKSAVGKEPPACGRLYLLTHLDKSEAPIYEFAWAQNGQLLGISRERSYHDLALIKGIR